MKVKFYLLPLILFLNFVSAAQDCSTVTISCTTSESRCVATGSITVNASGGSGNFNYKAVGPVTTTVTSSNTLTGLPGGYYTVQVIDMINNCTKELDSVFIPGNYNDPRFQLIKTDATCAGNDGTIEAFNVQYGRAPFTYTIIAPSPSHIGTSNTSGMFTGLTAGEYYVQLTDSCGGIQVRAITIENYSWWIDALSVTKLGCDSADIYITIKDNEGNTNLTGMPYSFTYGVVKAAGDTAWSLTHNFRMYIGNRRSLKIVVKDECGNIQTAIWHLPNNVKPSLSAVGLDNPSCTDFTASVTGQNLTNPNFCLYDDMGVMLSCNSTGLFNNIPYGSYCIRVTDLCYDTVITRCFSASGPNPSVAANVDISNISCTGFTATVSGQSNLTNPNYCLYNASNIVVACNNTGIFTNVPFGTYCIEIENGCLDTTITRCFTVNKPLAALTGYAITGSTCSAFNVSASGENLDNPVFCLYDSLGNIIACNSTGIFTGLDHGNYCIRAISCGDTTNSVCFSSSRPVPSLGAGVQITYKQCNNFGVAVWGQTNLTNPQYCIYDSNDSLIACNTTGSFDSLPYGSYCIEIANTCYDTIITRCFTQNRTIPSLSNTMQVLSSTCNTVSFRANGTNLTSPNYCLYNASDSLLACNSSGIFNNYPFGTYCVKVEDGCVDTIITVCQTFAPVRGISLLTSKSCNIGTTYIDVEFENGNSPYNVKVYHPNGTLMHDANTSANPLRIELGFLPSGTQYKVVGTDNCGNIDSASIAPDANIVTRSASVRAKCPSATWLNGAGDILANCTTNHHTVTPQIIKKNGAAFVSGYSSVSANTYTFADLEPATYIVEYTQSNCNSKVYDTVVVPPYAYPSQGQSAIYQCDNNSFSLGADVNGGVSPYSFQIIGSMPVSPDITTVPQSSPIFNINTGTTYSLVRLRTIDACGNATLSDVSVLPLQNISVTASDSCFFHNITLSVDTIPNAVYAWYRKTSPTDSVLLDSGLTFNLPFFTPEQAGEYVCKIVVNGGCLTRLSYFTLDGDCGMQTLPVTFQLQGKKSGTVNQLYWTNPDQSGVQKYIIERKGPQERNFTSIGSIPAHQAINYLFNDNQSKPGINSYRLKLVYWNKAVYTNVVLLRSGMNSVLVYPNPVKDNVNITVTADRPTDYLVEIVNAAGQQVYSTRLKNIQTATVKYTRTEKVGTGVFLVRITDLNANHSEIRKILFE